MAEGDYVGSWDLNVANNDSHGVGVKVFGGEVVFIQVINWSSNEIYKYSSNGSYLTKWDLDSSNDHSIGMSMHGVFLYILDLTDKTIYKYQEYGAGFEGSLFVLDSAQVAPLSVTTDGTNVWVPDMDDMEVYVYNMAGTLQTTWSLHVDNIQPQGICVRNGYIWINSKTDNRIYKYVYNTGEYVTRWSLNVANANSYGVATDGVYFWVADRTNNKVYKYLYDEEPVEGPDNVEKVSGVNKNNIEKVSNVDFASISKIISVG